MLIEVTTCHLDITDPRAMRPKSNSVQGLEIKPVGQPSPEFNRFLYTAVGADSYWVDRLPWTYRQWQEWVDRPQFQTWVTYVSGSPAGYFELDSQPEGSVEITSFGLLPRYIGRCLGGHFLTVALGKGWYMGASRVWLYTCSLDHPTALSNYQARGMRVSHKETSTQHLPSITLGP